MCDNSELKELLAKVSKERDELAEEVRRLKNPTAPASRKSILEAAKMCVCGDREEDYGSPERNFGTIAAFWEAYIAEKCVGAGIMDIATEDVAAMMALMKIARIAGGGGKADNWVDLAGYAACGGELEAR